MKIIHQYFPGLTETQMFAFQQLRELYAEWNEQINVVSRKDIEHIYEHHVLHSLSIARFIRFKPGTKLMDLGTGGGFPGIPLAILFPECRFHLVDSIGKKLKVVEAIKEQLNLTNIWTFHKRAEEMEYKYDFVVSRAVAPVSDLLEWTKGKYCKSALNERQKGLICLKGGNLDEELKPFPLHLKVDLTNYFSESFFQNKFLVYIPQ